MGHTWRISAILLLCCAAFSTASPATAQAKTIQVGVTAIEPAANTAYSIDATDCAHYGNYISTGFEAHLDSWPGTYKPLGFTVEIDNQNITGQDGTLANDSQYQVGHGYVSHGDADPQDFRGNVQGSFDCAPGTYYAQMSEAAQGNYCNRDTTSDPSAGTGVYDSCLLVSPVWAFQVVAPQTSGPPTPTTSSPPTSETTLSIADARDMVGSAILTDTGHSPTHLKINRCTRVTSKKVNCIASWYDKRYVWAGTWTMFLSGEGNDAELLYTFSGLRAKRSCLKHHSVSHCEQRKRYSA